MPPIKRQQLSIGLMFAIERDKMMAISGLRLIGWNTIA
jgi:hypothetical protein